MLVQAMGGLMAVMGEPDGGPLLCGAPVLDTLGAFSAGLGVVTALLHRERTGAGRAPVAALEPIFRERTVQAWMARLEQHDVLCAPVNRYADFPADPQVMASGMLVPEDHPRAGRITTLDPPIRFSRTPGGTRTHAPALGEHTDEVLRQAGLAPEAIARLRAAKIVG